ncbi:MAG TPA: site-specific integrase [Pyrinomonadaceae bacterium]|nr:site-specific integrase [Pyrinomonadaceae bacterium]
MNGSPSALKESAGLWSNPINTEKYERRSELTLSEQAELSDWMDRLSRGKIWKLKPHSALQSLFSPIDDILAVTRGKTKIRRAVKFLLAREMHCRNLSFWGWTQADWLDFLCCSAQDFYRRYPPQQNCRLHLLAICYHLIEVKDLHIFGQFVQYKLAIMIFGRTSIDAVIQRVTNELPRLNLDNAWNRDHLPDALCEVFLANRSPRLEDITPEILHKIRQGDLAKRVKRYFVKLSRILAGMGIIPEPLKRISYQSAFDVSVVMINVPPEWASFCRRWQATTTLAPGTRDKYFFILCKIGRWLAKEHPEAVDPAQWSRDLAAEFVAAVDRMKVGELVTATYLRKDIIGKPLMAKTKAHHLCVLRQFFQDCQEWEWIPRRFDPIRSFATPRSIRALIGPNPRIIDDAIWAKLIWAGLNLTTADLPIVWNLKEGNRVHWYPWEMVRAMALVWLMCALRSDEFCRLRLGCVRWQREDLIIPGTVEVLPKNTVCLLDVPVNKTGTSFTKPVDPVVGEAIVTWEQIRPTQPAALDPKTGELVHYLFSYRGKSIAHSYINEHLIPILCRKAGVPEMDARGPITSHRARATMASQLYNAREGMSVWDLKEWLNHRSLLSTEHYVKTSPTKLAKAYADAGYFGRNTRAIEVLIDQEAIRSGATMSGQPWKYYDLGHGFCTYEFFERCEHRMACARCDFYVPKGSSQAQIVEAKGNLQRMLQEIPLREEERAAVEDGLEALQRLSSKLIDVPTPAGATPRELGTGRPRELPVLPGSVRPADYLSSRTTVGGPPQEANASG